jgi:hypothetical protein
VTAAPEWLWRWGVVACVVAGLAIVGLADPIHDYLRPSRHHAMLSTLFVIIACAVTGGTGWWFLVIQAPEPTIASRRSTVVDQIGQIEALLADVKDHAYRQLVAAVIHAFEPQASLAVGSLVSTPDGVRKIDIEVRSPDKLRLTVVDVVDLPIGQEAGIDIVDSADSKRTDIKADVMLVCSNTGFDLIAIRKAKRKRIGLISVLRQGDERVKAVIEEQMYLRRVNLAPITIEYAGDKLPKNPIIHDIKYRGASIDAWLIWRAVTIATANPTIEQKLVATFNLKQPTEFDIRQSRVKLQKFSVRFQPHIQWLSQTVRLDAATGIYDYLRGKVRFAPGANSYTIQGIDFDRATPLSSPPDANDLAFGLVPGEVDVRLVMFEGLLDGMEQYNRKLDELFRPEDLTTQIDSMRSSQ